MRMYRRRDQLRTCTKCGTEWVVPQSLVRTKRRRRGISFREGHMFGPGSLTNATAGYALDLAHARNAAGDAVDDAVDALAVCPSCGAPTYVEQPVRQRGKRR